MTLDEKLIEAFGVEAAELDRRAQQISGQNPASVLGRPAQGGAWLGLGQAGLGRARQG